MQLYSKAFCLISIILCCNLTFAIAAAVAAAAAAAAPAVNPEYRDFLIEHLRASEAEIARNYCAVCYESIADYRATVFRDKAGLLRSTPVDVDSVQPMAEAIRMSAVSVLIFLRITFF